MLIKLEQVYFAYRGGNDVIRGLTLSIERGESVALVGPSGSGKSTLLELIGGLLTPSSGRIQRDTDPANIRWIFQAPTTLERRTSLSNVALGALSQMSRHEALRRAELALDRIGMIQLADRPVHTLSGGEQQRVQIARALAGNPPLVLADEPTGQLDQTSTGQVTHAMQTLLDSGTAIVVATHDHSVASWCDRILEITNGQLVEET